MKFPEPSESPSTISSDLYEADRKVAENLEISPGTIVFRIQKLLYCYQTEPYAYIVHYVRRDLAPDLLLHIEKEPRLLIALRSTTDYSLFRTEEHITALSADFLLANLLRVKPGDPLLAAYGVTSSDGRNIECTETYTNTKYSGYKHEMFISHSNSEQ